MLLPISLLLPKSREIRIAYRFSGVSILSPAPTPVLLATTFWPQAKGEAICTCSPVSSLTSPGTT